MVTYPHCVASVRLTGRYAVAIGRQALPTQPLPREAEDFPKWEKHFEHVSPLTYLIYLSPKELYIVDLFKVYCSVKNLPRTRFELSSRQARCVESVMFYPFGHRATQSMIN